MGTTIEIAIAAAIAVAACGSGRPTRGRSTTDEAAPARAGEEQDVRRSGDDDGKTESETTDDPAIGARASAGELGARPLGRPRLPAPGPGVAPLGLSARRDGYLYVPKRRAADRAGPLVVLLHGAGGDGRGTLGLLQGLADEHDLLLLAPTSVGPSWDLVVGELGPDVAALDRALAWVFDRFAVDAGRVVISGFSDGASYALAVGLANGDLFSHVAAFSPGFSLPPQAQGRPRVYVSHGTRDAVLPIEVCSRVIVPRLRRLGYDVVYREFDGPHTVPTEIVREAVTWVAARS